MAESIELQPMHFYRSMVERLVGIYGEDEGEVINFILKQWYSQNYEKLELMGIRAEHLEGMPEMGGPVSTVREVLNEHGDSKDVARMTKIMESHSAGPNNYKYPRRGMILCEMALREADIDREVLCEIIVFNPDVSKALGFDWQKSPTHIANAINVFQDTWMHDGKPFSENIDRILNGEEMTLYDDLGIVDRMEATNEVTEALERIEDNEGLVKSVASKIESKAYKGRKYSVFSMLKCVLLQRMTSIPYIELSEVIASDDDIAETLDLAWQDQANLIYMAIRNFDRGYVENSKLRTLDTDDKLVDLVDKLELLKSEMEQQRIILDESEEKEEEEDTEPEEPDGEGEGEEEVEVTIVEGESRASGPPSDISGEGKKEPEEGGEKETKESEKMDPEKRFLLKDVRRTKDGKYLNRMTGVPIDTVEVKRMMNKYDVTDEDIPMR